MVFGIGAFASATMRTLHETGAELFCYLMRPYGQYGPIREGPCYDVHNYPNPCPLLRELAVDLVIPMSIDWHYQSWTEEFISMGIPVFSPVGGAMLLERDRNFARVICKKNNIPFPRSHVASNRLEAEQFLEKYPKPYVIKNPLCSPTSPIHTIVCESVEDTRAWLARLDYAEGVFLQEYLGRCEAGHVALVSDGQLYSLVSNQEYKRAFDGNMGPVAGAPLGGLIEADPEDRYGLAKELLNPLLPWFRETGFNGPVQVTAVKKEQRWHVIEYNVRTGVTTGPTLWRMLENPLEILQDLSQNRPLTIRFRPDIRYGCSLTLAGWGYPYIEIEGPHLPVGVHSTFDCDVWWNEVAWDEGTGLVMTGHRICDVAAVAYNLSDAVKKAYENIKKIDCLSSYYRRDIGQSLWPPGG